MNTPKKWHEKIGDSWKTIKYYSSESFNGQFWENNKWDVYIILLLGAAVAFIFVITNYFK